jgi:hypothetical protein
MVGTIGFQLGKNRKITGFGSRVHRRPTRGSGVSKSALVHSLANALLGSGVHRRRAPVHRRRTVRSAGSYKLSGQGVRRKPRATLTRRRTVHRRPRLVII